MGPPSADPSSLFADEAVEVRRAVEKRRREFAAGREIARGLLTQLGHDRQPLVAGPDRAPRWPPGIVGSISHCDELCLVVVAPESVVRSIGVDVEPAFALPDDASAMVVSAGERRALAALREVEPKLAERLVFSAKESVHKCLNPVLGVTWDFLEVEIELQAEPVEAELEPRGTFHAHRVPATGAHADALRTLRGRYGLVGGLVATSAVLLPC